MSNALIMRITLTLPDEYSVEVVSMAISEKRKVAQMASILIQQAIKERNRKKKKDDKGGNPE